MNPKNAARMFWLCVVMLNASIALLAWNLFTGGSTTVPTVAIGVFAVNIFVFWQAAQRRS